MTDVEQELKNARSEILKQQQKEFRTERIYNNFVKQQQAKNLKAFPPSEEERKARAEMDAKEFNDAFNEMRDLGVSISDIEKLGGSVDTAKDIRFGAIAASCMNGGKVTEDEAKACFNHLLTIEQKNRALDVLTAQAESERPYDRSLTELIRPEYTPEEMTEFAESIRNGCDSDPKVIAAVHEVERSDMFTDDQRKIISSCLEPSFFGHVFSINELMVFANPVFTADQMRELINGFRNSDMTLAQASIVARPDLSPDQMYRIRSALHSVNYNNGKTNISEEQVKLFADPKFNSDQMLVLQDLFFDVPISLNDSKLLANPELSSHQMESIGLLFKQPIHIQPYVNMDDVRRLAAAGLPENETSRLSAKIKAQAMYKHSIDENKMLGRDLEKFNKEMENPNMTEPYRRATQRGIDGVKVKMSINNDYIQSTLKVYPDIEQPIRIKPKNISDRVKLNEGEKASPKHSPDIQGHKRTDTTLS